MIFVEDYDKWSKAPKISKLTNFEEIYQFNFITYISGNFFQ